MRPGSVRSRWAALALSCLLCSCTVTKPVVCTFTWPVLLFAEPGTQTQLFGHQSGTGNTYEDGRTGAYILLGFLFAIGPVGGLVTGVISDINVLTGESTSGHPARNLYHPLLTNARGSGVEGFSP